MASTLLCVSFRPWSIIVACLGIDENSRRKFNKNIQPHQKTPHFFSRNLRLFSPNCGRFAGCESACGVQRCRRCTCSRSVTMQENEPSIQRCIVIMCNLHSSDRLVSRKTYTIQWLWLLTLHCLPASHLIILPRTSPHTLPTLRPTCRVGAWPQPCSA